MSHGGAHTRDQPVDWLADPPQVGDGTGFFFSKFWLTYYTLSTQIRDVELALDATKSLTV